MILPIVSSFLVIVSVCSSQDFTLTSLTYNHRPHMINKFPYLVGLHARPYICGGSLISQSFILTAGHCIFNTTLENITVFLGSIYIKRGTRRTPRSKIVHPEFVRQSLYNDIALLEIDPIKFGINIQKIALPALSGVNESYVGKGVIASGWGKTSNTSGISSTIRPVELFIISNTNCSKAYRHRIVPETQLCAASPSGSAICEGDSGGPLVLKESNVLIGITSYSPTPSCTPHFGSAFTRIASYRQWIEDNTGI